MAAAPWYLLAIGIVLVVLGGLLTGLANRGSGRDYVDPRMSDDEIGNRLEQSQGNPLGSMVMLVGFLVVLISIVWRIARIFV